MPVPVLRVLRRVRAMLKLLSDALTTWRIRRLGRDRCPRSNSHPSHDLRRCCLPRGHMGLCVGRDQPWDGETLDVHEWLFAFERKPVLFSTGMWRSTSHGDYGLDWSR